MTAYDDDGPRDGESTASGGLGSRCGNDDGPRRLYSRRRYLRGVGATTSGLFLARAPPARGESTTQRLERYRGEFGTVLDVVEAGADPTGRTSVVDVIRRYAGDDTLLVFPPGRYAVDETIALTGFDRFGLVGNDATLVPAGFHDFSGPHHALFRLGTRYAPGNRLVVDGFRVDQAAQETGVRAVDAVVRDGLEVRDITVDGRHDSGTAGPGRFVVVDPDGTGLVEGFSAPDGGASERETPNAGNVWRGPSGIVANGTQGELTVRDCVLGAFPDDGLSATGGDGRIVVDGGHFSNSHGASVHLGGVDSVVRDATVRVDETPAHFGGQRGIVLEAGTNLTVDGTTVDVAAETPRCTALSLAPTCGDAHVEEVTVSVRSSVPATAIDAAANAGFLSIVGTEIDHHGPAGYGVFLRGDADAESANFERVRITGDVGDGGGSAAIRNLRNDVRFVDTVVGQPGGDTRDGLVTLGDDCAIVGGTYRARRFPVVDAGAGTRVTGVRASSYGDAAAYCRHGDGRSASGLTNVFRGGVAEFGDGPVGEE